jgi:hypothetical protein
LLVSVILGAYVVSATQAIIVKVSVCFLPWWVNLAHPPKCEIYALIDPPGKYRPRGIDPDTVLLEDVLAPIDTCLCWLWLVAEFDSEAVVDVIWAKIYHMSIPPGIQTVSLKITGQFWDGTPFEGVGRVIVKVPDPL